MIRKIVQITMFFMVIYYNRIALILFTGTDQ